MTTIERSRLIQLLHESRREFLAAIENVVETQWNWNPGPDCWSVGQTAEHIVLSEVAMFGAVQRAICGPAHSDWEMRTAGKAELLECVLPNRGRKALAPDRVRPHGLSRMETTQQFEMLRADTIGFVAETKVALKQHLAEHPFPIFSPLNAYQWLLYIPLHNLRHIQQILEIKNASGYPR